MGRAQRVGGRPPPSELLEAELFTKPLQFNKYVAITKEKDDWEEMEKPSYQIHINIEKTQTKI